jgi:hypothetical protein
VALLLVLVVALLLVLVLVVALLLVLVVALLLVVVLLVVGALVVALARLLVVGGDDDDDDAAASATALAAPVGMADVNVNVLDKQLRSRQNKDNLIIMVFMMVKAQQRLPSYMYFTVQYSIICRLLYGRLFLDLLYVRRLFSVISLV